MADYISALTGPEMDEALLDMAEHNSEAWAVGERKGVPVQRGDETYQNNAKYWAEQAQSASASVTIAVTTAEGAASQAATSATSAQSAATDAAGYADGAGRAQDAANTAANRADDAADRAEAAAGAIAGAVRFDIQQSLTDAEKARARQNIGAEGGSGGGGGATRNLLDNSWFTVNQAAAIYIEDWGGLWEKPMMDRWRGYASNIDGGGGVFLAVDGDALDGVGLFASDIDIWQPMEESLKSQLNGKTVCASMLIGGTVYQGNTVYSSAPQSVVELCTGGGVTMALGTDGNIHLKTSTVDDTRIVRAVKLEVGSASTLGNDVAPDYGAELRKCQRHRWVFIGLPGYPFAFGAAKTDYNEVTQEGETIATVALRYPVDGVTYNNAYYSGGSISIPINGRRYYMESDPQTFLVVPTIEYDQFFVLIQGKILYDPLLDDYPCVFIIFGDHFEFFGDM